ncbi:MAG: DUF58 domain-containing protein [Thermodesulfobacteriota bacterium]|nr:DUF58 domain-containing protein [Thermodesulfobacteriota bacterium]
MKIVPNSRLLFWTGMMLLPLAFMATGSPIIDTLSFIFFAVLLILVLIDAFLASKGLQGISVQLPEVICLSKGREANIEIYISNDRLQIKRLRLGLSFPPQIYSHMDQIVSLPKEEPCSSFLWPCRALKQGRFILNRCYMEVDSPLGFWTKRSIFPMRTEIRVYPNLIAEHRILSALFTRKQPGLHSQRQLGKGRDFEQLREYIPGDSFEDIHWKATAKRGYPITKVFQIERTQQVYMIIDASRLSARKINHFHVDEYAVKSHSKKQYNEAFYDTIFERFVRAALTMSMAAQNQGDLFGILTFSEQVQGFIKAKNGKAHFNACRDMLFTLEPKSASPDFSEVFTFIGNRIRKRALLIFLTNLDDPVLSESFIRNIDSINKRHLLLINMINPKGARPVFSSSNVNSVDDLYVALGGQLIWESLRETGKILKRHGTGFSLLDSEKMCIQMVSQYLDIKQRQML